MPLTVADIMTTDLVTLLPTNTVKDAHDLTRSQGVRHLPVVDSATGQLQGLVTQKALVGKVISLLTLYGKDALSRREHWTNIMEIAELDCETLAPNTLVKDVATYFVKNRHGCMPVVDNSGKVVGIVTSSDFVRLAVELLAQRA